MKRTAIAAFLLLACSALLGAGEVDVAIRYFDKRVYYAGAETGPVLVQVTVSNRGQTPYRFRLADERAFSIDFEIRSMTNRILEPAQILIRKRTQDQHVFFREISIAPGESLSFTEDLRDYAELNAAGSYVVQARLHPELYRPAEASPSAAVAMKSAAASIDSNRLPLTLRLSPLTEGSAPPAALDVETGAVLVRENMPPDRVIEYLLSARQKGQWEKFFLYLDLESMISRDGARKRAWLSESEEGRRRMLDRYRSDLRNALVDGDISTIPIEFVIEKTTYGAEQGTIIAVEKFRFGTYTERKRYTYYVKRRDDVWMVYDYSVVNLGTE